MRTGPMTPSLLPYSPRRDVYRLLGIPASASSDEIQAACRRLARTFHPDRNQSHRATQEMQVVNVVRQVMTDPEQRARYDRERRRFLAELAHPMPPQLSEWRSITPNVVPERPSAAIRYLRAALVGARAVLLGLAPPRCPGCRAVIAGDDVYCAACGTPRLTTGV